MNDYTQIESPADRMGDKSIQIPSSQSDMIFGYDALGIAHKPRTISVKKEGTLNLFWDRNGNLA